MITVKKAVAFFIIISVILFFLIIPKHSKGQVQIVFANAAGPPIKAISSIHKLPSLLFSGTKSNKENAELKKKIAQLNAQIVNLKEAELENQRLHMLLGLKNGTKGLSVPARVIARDSSIWRDSLLLDKGTKASIKRNMVVIANEGLVGRVTETGPWFCRATVISDPNSRVSAIVQRTREQGIVEGNVLGQIRLKYLDADADVKVGDIVLTSS
jgi:rod shape-determining protein MreC